MRDHDTVRGMLEERLARLLSRVGRIEGDLRQPHDRDWQERATELENDEVLEGLDEITRREVTETLAALGRIADGSYGTCASCGRPMEAGRLAAVPTARTCMRCAGQ
jgi:RNA polymerase-binding transcription factor DksA